MHRMIYDARASGNTFDEVKMSVEDWDGAPFQVVVTQVSGERDVYTFEAKEA